jgi:hypothetical protein
MHGLSPRTIKGQEWWDEQRQIAYAKTEYCCAACGVSKNEAKYHLWLEAHELYEIDYDSGRMLFVEIVALCHSCHNYIHSGRMKALVNKGEMTEEKRADILMHGDALIEKAKLKKPRIPSKCAEWGKWRLVMDGVEYKGKFKTIEDWMQFYS